MRAATEMVRDFLASPYFHIFGVPLLLMIIGGLAKRLGRRDGDDSPARNDWAVGTTILLMVLGAILGDLRIISDSSIRGWLVGVLLMTFVSLDHDRYRSWQRRADGSLTNRKRIFVGIVFPNAFSLLTFALYQAQKLGVSP